MTKSILKQFVSLGKGNHSKPGMVYLQQAQDGTVKVGLSTNVAERKRRLERDYGQLIQLAAVPTFNMKWLESIMKEEYKEINFHKAKGLSGRTEWFMADDDTVLQMIGCLYLKAIYVNGCYILGGLLAFSFAAVVLF